MIIGGTTSTDIKNSVQTLLELYNADSSDVFEFPLPIPRYRHSLFLFDNYLWI